uniref:Uncharacterized protein n=1 Tax=Glossina pallidipes TaxID=7398 RepID=A0A1A9ZSL1_GLOPL
MPGSVAGVAFHSDCDQMGRTSYPSVASYVKWVEFVNDQLNDDDTVEVEDDKEETPPYHPHKPHEPNKPDKPYQPDNPYQPDQPYQPDKPGQVEYEYVYYDYGPWNRGDTHEVHIYSSVAYCLCLIAIVVTLRCDGVPQKNRATHLHSMNKEWRKLDLFFFVKHLEGRIRRRVKFGSHFYFNKAAFQLFISLEK